MNKLRKILIVVGGIMVMLLMGTTALADGNLAQGKPVEFRRLNWDDRPMFFIKEEISQN